MKSALRLLGHCVALAGLIAVTLVLLLVTVDDGLWYVKPAPATGGESGYLLAVFNVMVVVGPLIATSYICALVVCRAMAHSPRRATSHMMAGASRPSRHDRRGNQDNNGDRHAAATDVPAAGARTARARDKVPGQEHP